MAPAEWRCRASDLAPGTTVTFQLERDGGRVSGFLVAWDGGYHAYVNRCPHAGTPLDLWPNEFFSEDGSVLVCSTHGALFEPASGRCVAGPCAGDALDRLAVRREGDSIVVNWPAR